MGKIGSFIFGLVFFIAGVVIEIIARKKGGFIKNTKNYIKTKATVVEHKKVKRRINRIYQYINSNDSRI